MTTENTGHERPQVYVYLTSGGILDYEVTRGDVDIVSVDWDELAERTVEDWDGIIATLESLAPGPVREAEIEDAREERQKLVDEEEMQDALAEQRRAKAIADAEALLRTAGRL